MENNDSQSKGQIKNIENLSNKIKRVSNEGVFMSVTKKAEKITTALYMLTDLIPDNDPMRQSIRQNSLVVMSDIRGLSYLLTGDLYFQLARVIAKSWELVSLLEVSVVVGFISDMNYQIVKNALIEFISDLRNRQRIEGFGKIEDMKLVQGQAGQISLKSDFFDLTSEEMKEIEKENSHANRLDNSPALKNIPSEASQYKGHTKHKMSFINSNVSNKAFNTVAIDRQGKILQLVKEKNDISIKDIVSYFKEYNPKTIQRDLNALIEQNKVRRVGEKRWSRYSGL